MLVLEITKDKEVLDFIYNQTKNHPEIEVFEVESLNLEPIVQIIVPITAILAPVVTSIVSKIIENNKVTIKYKDITVSAGTYEEAMGIFKQITKQK